MIQRMRPLLVTTALLVAEFYELRIAPSNTNIAYMALNGYVYKTSNLSSCINSSVPCWSRTGFSRDSSMIANDVQGAYGSRIAIDPVNSDIVLVCTEKNGCFKSFDGGTSFSALTGLTSSTVSMIVCFDPSTISGQSTPGIYVASYNIGVYHTTGGVSGSWTLTPNSPSTQQFILCGPDGTVYLTDNVRTNDLHVYSSGRWRTSRVGNGGTGLVGVALDPFHSVYASGAHITVINSAGQTSFTQDSGESWTGYQATTRTAADIPWLQNTNENFMSAYQITYDPAQPNILYFSEGIGVWTTHPGIGSGVAWVSTSSGIEQLVSQWVISPPGGSPLFLFQDRPIFLSKNPNMYPSHHGVDEGSSVLQQGFSADWPSDRTPTIVVVANLFAAANTSGYSSDSGSTWQPFASDRPFSITSKQWGGGIAALTSGDFMWIPDDFGANLNSPWITSDGGKSWSAVNCPGVPSHGPTGWGANWYNRRQTALADRVNAVYYAINIGSPGSGVYQITPSGKCSRVYSGNLDGFGGANTQARTVPGRAGNIFYTSGDSISPHPASEGFYLSSDGGASFKEISGLSEVWSFGVGKAAPGSDGYPTLYVYGWFKGALGLWQAINVDLNPTWVQLSNSFINDSIDTVVVVEGDNNIFGRVYVCFAGSGCAYGQFDSPPDLAATTVKNDRRVPQRSEPLEVTPAPSYSLPSSKRGSAYPKSAPLGKSPPSTSVK